MKFFLPIALICIISVACGHGAHLNKVEDEEVPEAGRKSSSIVGDLRFFFKTYQDCASSDLSTCLKLKLYTAVDRIARSNGDFKVSDGVSFVKESDDESAEDIEPVKSESEIEASLPRSLDDKEQTLNSMIFDKITSFFEGHTLKIKFPSAEDIKQSIEEARQKGGLGGGKDKKHGHYIMIPLLLGSTLVPLAFGALALLAGKALIVSKLALALASIIGIKKLISSGHHHDGAHEVVVAGGHSGGWGRNSEGHNIAYKGHQQE